MPKNKKVKIKTSAIVKFQDDQIEIRVDINDRVNLTELWRMAGSPNPKRPKDWLDMKESKEFVEHIKVLKGPHEALLEPLEIRKGRSGGTYADIQIALKYAQWLSPEFQKTVNDVYLERIEEEIDPELGIQRAVERHTRRLQSLGRDSTAIVKRLKTVERRNVLTSVLQEHGVTAGPKINGYAKVTNAQYVGWKGMTKDQINKDLGLGPKENPRDHFNNWELDQIAFIDALTVEKIKSENPYGTEGCAAIGHSSGKAVGLLVTKLISQ